MINVVVRIMGIFTYFQPLSAEQPATANPQAARVISHAQQLLDGRFALDHQSGAVLEERFQSRFRGGAANLLDVGVLADQLADLVGDEQEIEDAGALVIAVAAACFAHCRLLGLIALVLVTLGAILGRVVGAIQIAHSIGIDL